MKRLVFFIALLTGLLLTIPMTDNYSTAEAATIKDVPKNAHCPLCNMVVYQKNHKMGIFSSQAIKKNGKISYYDDIGCLLYDEVLHKRTHQKYVIDYKTKKWIRVEKAVFVKTRLKSPMNWGYIAFAKKSDANNYISKNKKSNPKIVSIATIKKQAITRYKNQFFLSSTDKLIIQNPVASLTPSLQKDVPAHTDCEFCNMVVYTKKSHLGVFSAQAIKKNGKVAYYDDISCLLYAEVRNKETNRKFVRDYTTLSWIKAEDATYVKTTLHSPMDDGYLYFAKKAEAEKYVAEHKGSKIVSYEEVRDEAILRYS